MWGLIDCLGTLIILAILTSIWVFHFKRQANRRIWTCIRYQGGGTFDTPRAMTLVEAHNWLAKSLYEIAYVDHDHGFIFYRSIS